MNTAGELSSPLHPDTYFHNTNCTWVISAPEDMVVEVPKTTGEGAPRATWRLNGTVRVRTTDKDNPGSLGAAMQALIPPYPTKEDRVAVADS